MTKEEFESRLVQLPDHHLQVFGTTEKYLQEDLSFYVSSTLTLVMRWALVSLFFIVWGFIESATLGLVAMILASISAHYGKNYIMKTSILMTIMHMINVIIMLRSFEFTDSEITAVFKFIIPSYPKQKEHSAAAAQTAFQYLSGQLAE